MIYAGDRNALEEMVGYYDGLKQGIEIVQQENKELKEQLLVTQTNEETFRLEMEDITRALGLAEDTIFDDVKAYAKSLKDNMFEKEQLNSLVNSCQEEIRRLKKQLENKYEKVGTLTGELLYEENTKLINQQKEFIEYMNKTIEELECDDVDDEEMKGYLIQRIDTFKEILSKYKEIIGDVKNENK